MISLDKKSSKTTQTHGIISINSEKYEKLFCKVDTLMTSVV